MLWFDTAMMRSLYPSFQVAENEMDHGQVRLGLVWVAAERQRLMAVSRLSKSGVARPSIGAQDRARGDVLFDKAGERGSAPIWHNAKPEPSRIDATSLLLPVILTRSNFDRSNDDRLVVSSAAFSAKSRLRSGTHRLRLDVRRR